MAHYLQSDIAAFFQSIIADKRQNIEDLPEELEVFRGIAIRKKSLPDEENMSRLAEFPISKAEKSVLMTSHVNGYETREGQLEMMDAVYEAFTTEKHAVIEAGTGIGKSLGYLLPSVYFAIKQKEPVVISTYTIQMQDQLLKKEINRLADIVPFSFRAAILKGRSNYVNMLKFEQSLRDDELQYDSVMTKMQLLVWLIHTETGDMEELNFSSGGKLYWQRIKHDGWFLQKEKDPWISRDFYLHARQLASTADLVITNHAMLLMDIEREENLLPDYRYVIIDEAQHLEKAARKCFGNKLEYNTVKYLLGRLGTLDKQQLFAQLEKMIQGRALVPALKANKLDYTITELDAEIDDFYMLLSKVLIRHDRRKAQKLPKQQVRLNETIKSDQQWQALLMCAERVRDFHSKVCDGLTDRLQLIKEKAEKTSAAERAFLEEVNSFFQEWASIGEKINQFIIRPQETDVIWLEGDSRTLPNSLIIQGQPENPGNLLAERFFTKKKSVVMTSATLTVNRSFQYFTRELGLAEFPLIEKQITSPFQYDKMTKLMIPTDLPEIRSSKNDEYIEAISGHLIGIAEATEGRMLVLFTSYDMLRKTYNLIKDSGALEDFLLLAQGVSNGSRTRLTKNFQQFNKAILFGTSSFWEGIDIPGKDLSCLIIVRLPFSPPDEPVTEARSEAIKRIDKNPFTEYSLPEAIIRFRQGFGRLIRSKTDRGIVIVFDRRIDTTSYGKAFIQSIPDVPIERGPLESIIDTIEKWL